MVVLCLRLRAHSALTSFAKGYEDFAVDLTIALVLPCFGIEFCYYHHMLRICLNLHRQSLHYEDSRIA